MVETLMWEKVSDTVERFKVPGGWLYRTSQYGTLWTTVYVPDNQNVDAQSAIRSVLEPLRDLPVAQAFAEAMAIRQQYLMMTNVEPERVWGIQKIQTCLAVLGEVLQANPL